MTARSASGVLGARCDAGQSSRRICVEHANAEQKQWRPLPRFLGRRESYAATHRAVAALVSDRAAQRPTQRKPCTELVPVTTMAC